MKKCIYALDAGGTFLKCALVDEQLAVIPETSDSQPVDSACGSADDIRAAYSAIAARAKARAAELGYEISAVGMDTPGPFEYSTGTFRMTHKYPALFGISVLPWFGEDFPGVPVKIIHDSAAFIIGSSAVSKNGSNGAGIAGVMLGTGLGFAIMKNGKPLLNENGGPRVSIYKTPLRGKEAEEIISARGISRRYAELSCESELKTALEVAILAKGGDKAAKQTYSELGDAIGELLKPILDEYQIEVLLVGGQISRDLNLFSAELIARLAGCKALKKVCRAPDADEVHLIGAAIAAVEA